MKNIKIKFNYLLLFFLFVSLLSGYIKYSLYILFIITFHELGHILISLILGYKIISIELFPFGGVTKIDKPLNTPIINDFLISIFGIVFQIILFFFIKDNTFLEYNKNILLFNLLPIIPLDGSKIIFEFYNIFFSYKKSIKLYYVTSIIFIIIYIIINYQYMLNNYLIITLFIFKTIEIIKNKRIIYHKFILERKIYDNLKFSKVKNKNESINNYHKDIKYYYIKNNKIIDEKEYLKNKY